MKKVTGMVLAIMMVLVLAGAASAWWGGPGMGYGPGYSSGVNLENIKKFQKETFGLRDDLAAKQLDLQSEYGKPIPDTARVAALRKDIIDIQAKIQVVADKYGTAWGAGSGQGMMMGQGQGMMRRSGCRPCPCMW